jgi:hypothetical protein
MSFEIERVISWLTVAARALAALAAILVLLAGYLGGQPVAPALAACLAALRP